MGKKRKNTWLNLVNAKAESHKGQSINDPLDLLSQSEDSQKTTSSSLTDHPLGWVFVGVGATIFLGNYWNTLQENYLLRAEILKSSIHINEAKPIKTGFDLYERVDIPEDVINSIPVINNTSYKTKKLLTPADPEFYCQYRVGGCGLSI